MQIVKETAWAWAGAGAGAFLMRNWLLVFAAVITLLTLHGVTKVHSGSCDETGPLPLWSVPPRSVTVGTPAANRVQNEYRGDGDIIVARALQLVTVPYPSQTCVHNRYPKVPAAAASLATR